MQDAHGQTTGLLFHVGTIVVPYRRIDALAAAAILADNAARARSRTPGPGTEAALRRVLDAMRTGKPNYDEMTPWRAEIEKQQTRSLIAYARMGAVRSIEFRGVDRMGRDVYEVHQEGGASGWGISLDSTGLIESLWSARW